MCMVPGGSGSRESACSAAEPGLIPGEGKGTSLQDSCLETSWTEEPGRLQSIGSQRDGHDSATDTHTQLSVTGMNPLSPYLNVDPRYLVQDTDEFILPTGANKTRGRFELAFFTIGGCCMTGAAFGAMNGLRLGLKETQNMAWSKPRNVQILNMVTRQGALWANTLGSLALLYSAFGVIIEKTRGAEDDLNTVAAGTMTGMLYKCTGGLRGAARGGLAGLTLTSLYALYNNWEHMKGSVLQQSL
uniref:Translocase of inner mitochondrial membrane 23 n=1 Tax=Ovis aries TaxID=9940 RepID=A0AC11E8A2_SHEEP